VNATFPSTPIAASDLHKRATSMVRCSSHTTRLVAAGSSAISLLSTMWMVKAGGNQRQLALATKARDGGCVPDIMPAVVTLERDFLDTGVLSELAQALLKKKHVRRTGQNETAIGTVALPAGCDLTAELDAYHERLYEFCSSHAAEAPVLVKFLFGQLRTSLLQGLYCLRLPPPLVAMVDGYVTVLWTNILTLLLKLDAETRAPLRSRLLGVLPASMMPQLPQLQARILSNMEAQLGETEAQLEQTLLQLRLPLREAQLQEAGQDAGAAGQDAGGRDLSDQIEVRTS
jgi:hypothetical protein